ncbi:hypothetical protein HAX54_016741 [Datura stramonium]|uniref:KIB1-4 beta-propeller domain-containing protein n=1 Tax=Datura stramonium TaxID=4076 RepID=A0ABS8ULR4_DATST|nr:hypothetical protein [Datura stramonium]
MPNISFCGVIKSWRAASKQCSANGRLPLLEISDKDYCQYYKTKEHTLNISFRSGGYWWYERRLWDTLWTRFHGCSHGLIVAGGKDPAQYCLLIPTARHSYWTVPPLAMPQFHSKQSTRKEDELEVFKLRMDDQSWLKLDNLGHRTIFAGTNCCMSVNASQLGCRSNCVYFTEHATDTWRLYEMGIATISRCFDDYGSETKSPVWEEPIEENKFLVR